MKRTSGLVCYLIDELHSISEEALSKIILYLESNCPYNNIVAWCGFDKEVGKEIVVIKSYKTHNDEHPAYTYYFDLDGEFRSSVEGVSHDKYRKEILQKTHGKTIKIAIPVYDNKGELQSIKIIFTNDEEFHMYMRENAGFYLGFDFFENE